MEPTKLQLELTRYQRKTFFVEAAQVTDGNMTLVAEWCGGTILVEDGNNFIKVDVAKVIDERQTKAFVGDFVLKAGRSFKVYTGAAFRKSFERVDGVAKDSATQAEKGQPQELRTTAEPATTS